MNVDQKLARPGFRGWDLFQYQGLGWPECFTEYGFHSLFSLSFGGGG